jgi:hypothetical protein
MPDDFQDLSRTLETVTGQLTTITGELAGIESRATASENRELKAEARSRKLTIWLTLTVIGFILDVVLTVVITFILFGQVSQSNAISHQETQLRQQQIITHQNQLNACAIGNNFRIGQKEFLAFMVSTFVGNAPNPPGFTPAQIAELKAQRRHEIASFTPALARTYKLVDCAALYPAIKK